MIIRHSAAGLAAAFVAVAGLAGCSSTSDAPAPSPSPTPTASATESPSAKPSPAQTGSAAPSGAAAAAATTEFNKKIQEALNAVGCHAGPVDGVLGGETDAAVLRFQQAKGLTADGELGPQTDAALARAAAAGETVCTQTTASPSPTVTHASGVSCTAASLSSAVDSGAKIMRFTCADYLDDRIAAGKVRVANGPDVSFYARVEGDRWISQDADVICGEAGSSLPPQIFRYCSDGE